MKAFDLLSDPNNRAMRKTWVGGVTTLAVVLVALFLLSNEYSRFSEKRVTKTIYVDNTSRVDTVDFFLAIRLKNAPCSIISIDRSDMLGHHVEDLPLERRIIHPNGHRQLVSS
jgi:hypothetical protein